MPKEVEDKLRKEAITRKLKGKKADSYVYGTMNKLGLMDKGGKASYKKISKKAVLRKLKGGKRPFDETDEDHI